MKKVLVAGAGHGGLSAAIRLAGAGYDVTVYERQARADMGYDWFDAVGESLFRSAGLPEPPEGVMLPFYDMRYFAPDAEINMTKRGTGTTVRFIDRKVLIRLLLEQAEQSGVRLVFETGVRRAVTAGTRIVGLELENGERVAADLVIDAAGVDSPVRAGLPAACGIKKEIPPEDRIVIYRAYYNRAGEGETDPRYNVHFYHCGKPGMDWVITEDDFIDVLIGGFGSLTQEQIDEALADFRVQYPYLGDTVVRGGMVAEIPLRKTLPLFVADGYAAVGDSACMTEPLSGSGITLSMKAGKMLADTVLGANGDCTARTLWRYNYKYCKALGDGYIFMDVARKLLGSVNAGDVTGLMQKEVLTMKEIAGGEKYTPADLYKKAAGILSMPHIIRPLINSGAKIANINAVCGAMPAVFDLEKILAWAEKYEALS